MPTRKANLIGADEIEHSILVIRGHRVMLDADLAVLYQVTTKRLNEQVKRNLDRFPDDFMIRLTPDEWDGLRSQIATSKGPPSKEKQEMGYHTLIQKP